MSAPTAPRSLHVMTVDLSLDVLLGYQLRCFADEGFDVVGVPAPGPRVPGLEAAGIRHAAVPRALDRFDGSAVVERTMQVDRRLLRRRGIPAPQPTPR